MANTSATPLARLTDPRPAVRRIAVMDALRDGTDTELSALTEHLVRERDERCALLLIRALAQRGYQPARPVLAQLRDDLSLPGPLAHAALLAHDALEVANRPPPPPPVVDPADATEDDA